MRHTPKPLFPPSILSTPALAALLCAALLLLLSGPVSALAAPSAASTSPSSADASRRADVPKSSTDAEIGPAEELEQALPTGGMTPVPGLERNERIAQTCSASTQCQCGNTISCTGSWDCFAKNASYVECDGNRTNCTSQSCTARLVCPTFQRITCHGTCNDCLVGPDWIYCNGAEYTCDDCPFPQFECSF